MPKRFGQPKNCPNITLFVRKSFFGHIFLWSHKSYESIVDSNFPNAKKVFARMQLFIDIVRERRIFCVFSDFLVFLEEYLEFRQSFYT